MKKVAAYGKTKLNELIASAEQLMLDRKGGADSISAYLKREAKGLLSRVHSGANQRTQTFTEYLARLEPLQEAGGAYGHDLYDMMAEISNSGNPQDVLQQMVETEIADRASNGYVGTAEDVVLPENFFASDLSAAEAAEMPVTHLLKAREYNNIRKYFHADNLFSDLSAREQALVESMRWSSDEFAKNFGVQDQVLYHELRTQLSNELVSSGDVSLAEITKMQDVEIPFEVSMPTYSVEKMMAGGYINEPNPDVVHDYTLEEQADRLRQKTYIREQDLRDMVHENPELTSRELVAKLQKEPSFAALAEKNIGDPELRFKYFIDLFDEEKAGMNTDLAYVLKAPEGQALLNSEQASALIEGLENDFTKNQLMDIIQYGEGGEILFKGSVLKTWLKNQTEGLKMAPVSMFILSHIADWNKGAAQFINVGLAVADVLFRGDPTSLLLNLTGMAFAEFNEMARKTIANQTPDSWNGRRFGYVRRGDTYVPAILREVEENTGFGQRGRTMKMQFADEGGELRWTFGGDGKLEPIFTNYLEESFHTTVDEMSQSYSLKYLQEHDILRSWFFVSPDEQADIVDGTQNGASWDNMNVDHSEMELDPYFNRLDNWRRALDLMTDYKLAPYSDAAGKTVIQEYPTSRALHEIYWKSKGHGAGIEAERFGDYMGVGQGILEERYKLFRSTHNPENVWLLDTVFANSVKDLIRTQKQAAKVEGLDSYDELVGEPGWTEKGGMSYWSANYMDREHEYPVANDANELQAQIEEIKNIPDYGTVQQNFLVQKALTRYWMGQITDLGGGNDLMDYLYKPQFDDHQMDRGIASDKLTKIDGHWHVIKDDNAYNLIHLGGKRTDTKIPMPWLNEGDPLLITDDVQVTDKYKTILANYADEVAPYIEDWHEKTKPKAEEGIAGALVHDKREFFFDKERGQQMYIDGIWRKLVNFENIGTGTVLTFSDGTTKVIDEERYDEKFRVREIDMDYFDQPDQDKTDMVQQILDERPDLYDRIYDAFQTMMSDDTDQEAYKVYNWLTRFWNGRETYASFPEQAVEQVVEEEEPVVEQVGEEDGKVSIEEDDGGNVEFVTYNGHRFHIDEVVGHSDKFQTKVEDYLRDEHGIDVPFADITPEQFPFLSFNEDGEPALFGDKDLHDDLGLDPNIRVAKDADGNVHQIWTPPTEVPKELLAK